MTRLTSDTQYEVVSLDDGNYAVRVMPIGGLETIVDGFKSEDEANNWIFSQQIVAVTDDELPSHI